MAAKEGAFYESRFVVDAVILRAITALLRAQRCRTSSNG